MAALVPAALGALQLSDTFLIPREHPAIQYSVHPIADAVSDLERRLRSGETRISPDPAHGYLPGLLEALDVLPSSQLLVFSKTSFQARLIGPDNPRALYFNDRVALGWVHGGPVMELAAQDPIEGTIFYTLDPRQLDGELRQPEAPVFKRTDLCLNCHVSSATLGVPGLFVGSVFPAPDGATTYAATFITDHRSPLNERWGGWYVTGHHGAMRHMGNAVVTDPGHPEAMIGERSLNVDSLDGRFDQTPYLRKTSDIVALMVLEHQTRAINLLTRGGWEARVAEYQHRVEAASLDDVATEIVDYLLFVDEAPLDAAITGSSTFSKDFAARGPKDKNGRSLRDFDLQTRLFRFPCSYLVYSPAFDALPDALRSRIYTRLWRVLSGAETSDVYRNLRPDVRRAIVEILLDTKPGLPAIFRGTIT
jgi:hypothetical protein